MRDYLARFHRPGLTLEEHICADNLNEALKMASEILAKLKINDLEIRAITLWF